MKSTAIQRFVDQVKVRVQAGNGGNGCTSFHRARSLPKGGPDGGDGGSGGSVIFAATTAEQSLTALQYLNHYEAGNGGHGMGKDRCGRNGEDVIVKVPVGSIIKDLDADGAVLCDLDHDGQQRQPAARAAAAMPTSPPAPTRRRAIARKACPAPCTTWSSSSS